MFFDRFSLIDVFPSMFFDRCFTVDFFAFDYRFYVVYRCFAFKDRVRDDRHNRHLVSSPDSARVGSGDETNRH